MARRNTQKKVTFEHTHQYTKDGTPDVKSTDRVAVINTEDDYIKIYFQGLDYIRDMPSDCFALLCELLQMSTYAAENSDDGCNYSFLVEMTSYQKEQIRKKMGYKTTRSVSNLMTQLLDGEIMMRLSREVYRLNPYLFGRGAFKNIIQLRLPVYGFYPPEKKDTFKRVYDRNVKNKRKNRKIRESIKKEEQERQNSSK